MGIKRKLGLGVASAALGISLVGGGTWAAFNDVETLSASYAAGKLDLTAKDTTLTGINLSNLKPGDVFEKEFTLDNVGTLAIKDVLLKLNHSNFKDYIGGDDKDIWGENSAEDFLKQFTITVISSGTEGGNGYTKPIVKNVNLFDFIEMTNGGGVPATAGSVDSEYYDEESGRINVITKTGADASYHGLPVNPDDEDKVLFTIKFDDKDEKDDKGLQLQNKYQGDSITLDFNFEARQWGGLTIDENVEVNEDGYIAENEKSHSEDGAAVDPGDGDDEEEPTPDPDPEQTYTVELVDYDYEYKFFHGHWDLEAEAKFEFSLDGEKVGEKSVTETLHDVNRHKANDVTFTVDYEGETYTETITVPKD